MQHCCVALCTLGSVVAARPTSKFLCLRIACKLYRFYFLTRDNAIFQSSTCEAGRKEYNNGIIFLKKDPTDGNFFLFEVKFF